MNFSSEVHKKIINPLASPGEEVSVYTYLYLSAGAPALGEDQKINFFITKSLIKTQEYNGFISI